MTRFIPAAVLLTLFMPVPAQAAPATFFGPIVPEICRSCPCGFNGVLQILQNLMNFGIAISIIVATIIIAAGGLLYIISATNPESRSTANKMLINAVIGLIIVLTAWLVVDFVMKALYKPTVGSDGTQWGPWNTILTGTGEDCIAARETRPLFRGNIFATPGRGYTANPTSEPLEGADGAFTYQSGIQAQVEHASPALRSLLSCMVARVPADVGEISSISDSNIVSRSKTFAQCAQGGCNHSANSCHYGGRSCTGQSYAVDFGDETNKTAITTAARACGAEVLDEGNHIHVSIGNAAGCGCRL